MRKKKDDGMMAQQWYQIRVKGHLGQQWQGWFDGLSITNVEQGEALLYGSLPDQAALHGVLTKIRDLGLPLLEVHRVATDSSLGGIHSLALTPLALPELLPRSLMPHLARTNGREGVSIVIQVIEDSSEYLAVDHSKLGGSFPPRQLPGMQRAEASRLDEQAAVFNIADPSYCQVSMYCCTDSDTSVHTGSPGVTASERKPRELAGRQSRSGTANARSILSSGQLCL
jgi:hypothetical protein